MQANDQSEYGSVFVRTRDDWRKQKRPTNWSGANFGLPPKLARDRVVATGISINALAILTEAPWLEGYFRRYVIGGPDAFVVAVRNPGSFAEAMLRKLVREVAANQMQ